MWLNQLFVETPIDFKKRCRMRITGGVLFALLGVAAVLLNVIGAHFPIMYLEEGGRDFAEGFYMGTGCGLIAAGVITVIKNLQYLKNQELGKKREVYECDERNRMIGLRCWAYTGYSFFVVLYVGMLVAGFISKTVLSVLLTVMALYACLLFIFRRLLQKAM